MQQVLRVALKAKRLFFLCVHSLLQESFLLMAVNEQRPDTGASYRQSKREMFVMVGLWLVMGIWVIGYGSQAAYLAESETPLRTVLGMPRWVFFGWVCPLLVANMFTLWFCLRFMKDEPMEEVSEDE